MATTNTVPGYREVLSLTLETLRGMQEDQCSNVISAVVRAAKKKGLLPSHDPPGTGRSMTTGRSGAEDRVALFVNEAMWDCVVKRIVTVGSDSINDKWPFYRVTDYGRSVLDAQQPQPYDPDGFLKHLDEKCGALDPTVRGYIAEALTAFNSGCTRSAAVMLGCASEKLILLLCEAFEAAVADTAKKEAFRKEVNSKWMISHRYQVLRGRLELMAEAKKLTRDQVETVNAELPAGYELLRRCRNAAGHPDVPGSVEPDTVFMNLRMFTEYARRVSALIEHFGHEPAAW